MMGDIYHYNKEVGVGLFLNNFLGEIYEKKI
jgi:hypothetical protein